MRIQRVMRDLSKRIIADIKRLATLTMWEQEYRYKRMESQLDVIRSTHSEEETRSPEKYHERR